jgi:hypothetical protein
MTTNEMRADVKKLLKRVDEDAKGTRCLTMAEVTLCLDELRRLATPSVASPQAAWKDDALQSRINEAVDEANGVTAAPVGEPGRTPQDDDPPPQCAFCNKFSPKHLLGCLGAAGVRGEAAPPAQGAPGTREALTAVIERLREQAHEMESPFYTKTPAEPSWEWAAKAFKQIADEIALAQPGAPTKGSEER